MVQRVDELVRLHAEHGELADLIENVLEQFFEASEKFADAESKFEVAKSKLAQSQQELDSASTKKERIGSFVSKLGYSFNEIFESYGKHRIEMISAKHSTATQHKYKSLPNSELILTVAEIIDSVNRPMGLQEILSTLRDRNILIPGKSPERNLSAYLSRSPLIISVKRGVYFIDIPLLRAAQNNRGRDQGLGNDSGR